MHLALTIAHGTTWIEFTQRAMKEALKKIKFKIPGGKMLEKYYDI